MCISATPIEEDADKHQDEAKEHAEPLGDHFSSWRVKHIWNSGIDNSVGETIMNETFLIAERMKCSRLEKVKILPVVELFISLSEQTRREGLLSLEKYFEQITQDSIISQGIKNVLDSYAPEIVQKVFVNRVVHSYFREAELLKYFVALEGVLGLQAGYNSRMMKDILLSYFGEDTDYFNDLYGNKYNKSDLEKRLHDHDFIEKTKANLFSKLQYSPETTILDDVFAKLDDRRLGMILRDADSKDILRAVKGASGTTCERIIRNLNKETSDTLCVEYSYDVFDFVWDIVSAQERILSITNIYTDELKFIQDVNRKTNSI